MVDIPETLIKKCNNAFCHPVKKTTSTVRRTLCTKCFIETGYYLKKVLRLKCAAKLVLAENFCDLCRRFSHVTNHVFIKTSQYWNCIMLKGLWHMIGNERRRLSRFESKQLDPPYFIAATLSLFTKYAKNLFPLQFWKDWNSVLSRKSVKNKLKNKTEIFAWPRSENLELWI